MNQRSRNRRRHATMPFGQLVESRNGRRIAQHHGDLPATGNAGGLALGAGLGLHSRIHQCVSVVAAHVRSTALGAFSRCPASYRLAVFTHDKGSFLVGRNRDDGEKLGDFLGGFDFHGYLRSGLIPPMCESYVVTSDVSTTILQVAA
jgi:hypothetical protein